MIILINLSDLNLIIQWLLIFILIIINLKDLNYNSFVLIFILLIEYLQHIILCNHIFLFNLFNHKYLY